MQEEYTLKQKGGNPLIKKCYSRKKILKINCFILIGWSRRLFDEPPYDVLDGLSNNHEDKLFCE